MKPEIKALLNWVTLYEEIGNAGLVCRRCGISRPTLKKWWKRYLAISDLIHIAPQPPKVCGLSFVPTVQ
jgi:hypothetical protein